MDFETIPLSKIHSMSEIYAANGSTESLHAHVSQCVPKEALQREISGVTFLEQPGSNLQEEPVLSAAAPVTQDKQVLECALLT